MSQQKLTERRIRQLRAPDPRGKQHLYWDGDLKGFGVLCSGVTNAKTYVLQRAIRGRTRRFTIAPTNVITLVDARKRAEKMLADIHGGIDPKVKLRGDTTLRGALTEYLKFRADLRPRSAASYRELVERHLKPWLDRPLRDVTRDMVEDQLRKIAATVARNNDQHNGHATANGAMRAFRVLYNFTADRAPPTAALPPNPVKLKKTWLPVKPRSTVIKPAEFPAFYAAVMQLTNSVARDYILLLLFTGMRRREASGLRWRENVDLDARVIKLPGTSTKSGKPLDLPMSDFIADLMVARRTIGDAKFVFPAPSRSGHIEEPRYFLDQVAEMSGVAVSVHDLRRTFITVAESADIPHLALKALVNHALPKDVTSGYVQMTVERLREPAQRVADKLRQLCRVTAPTGANVARLR